MNRLAATLTVLLIITTGNAREYYFRHFTNENGLSNNTVHCIIQDRQGFVWFGTKDGLNRFDGYKFKTFLHNPDDPGSIGSNMILTLCEDHDGLIWIGTPNGLFYYDPYLDRFSQITNSQQKTAGLISDIKVDSQDNIWYTSRLGLYRYNKPDEKLDFFPSYQFFQPVSICIAASGSVWIASSDGQIYKYQSLDGSFREYQVIQQAEIESAVRPVRIIDAGAEGLLVATNKAGIRRVDPGSGNVNNLCTKDASGNELLINDVIHSGEKEYWIGSESGIHIFDLEKGFTGQMVREASDPFSISNNAVRAFFRDSEGGLWIGTFYGGANYLPSENTPFTKYYPTALEGSIQGNVIRQICPDTRGMLWIGTEDAGLSRLDPRTGRFDNFYNRDSSSMIPSSNIHALLADGNLLYIGSFDNGIFIMDLRSGRVVEHLTADNPASGLKSNIITILLKTRDGNIYIGSPTGIHRYNPSGGTIEYLNDIAPQSFIYAMHEDKDGIIWIGTYGSGLYRYDRVNNRCEHLYHDPEDSLSLSSNIITSIFEDSENRIWFTTEGNGFFYFNRSDGGFMRYESRDGLPCNIFCAMQQDWRGLMWISSSKGLVCFNPETKEMKIFDKGDGLVDNQFNYNSTYKDSQGTMYFGTVNGLVSFNPSEFTDDTYDPPVYITGFQISGSEWEPNQGNPDCYQSILYTREISLRYNQSSFSIDFVAPSYTNPKTTQYRYVLEGYDDQWVYLPGNMKVYYRNIPPGSYRFRVQESDGNHPHDETEAALNILIAPPFWRSTMAITMYSILGLAILFINYRAYGKRKQNRHRRLLESLENKKEKEILNAKIDFFTNITHEIRTPLTLIKAPLDRLMKSFNGSGSDMENLSIMKTNTDRLLDLTTQLLDFRRTEKKTFRLNYKKVNVCEILEKTFNRFRPVAEERNIMFLLHRPYEEYTVCLDSESMIKIISNLLTNALKYTLDLVDVYLEPDTPDTGSVQIRVNSNGDLIPAELYEKIFEPFFQAGKWNGRNVQHGTGLGLPLARSLAELHHGRLYLDPNMEQINSFVLELPKDQPDLEEEKGEHDIHRDTVPEMEEELLVLNVFDNSKPVILFVDDEKDLCRFVSRELSEDYNVLTGYNGKEANEILRRYTVNLVISDVLMPVMDGYELCSIIKSTLEYCHIPVILLTASINLRSRIEGLESGADAYLEKPFTTELLLAQISNLFNNRKLACENYLKSPLTHYKTVVINKMDEDFMKRLQEIIMKQMSEPDLSVETIASLMNISLSTLYRKVKALTELNTNEYIRLYRLKKAAEMLLSNEYRINEVSYLVGFSSPSYFATSFLKQFGMSPSDFIKQNTKEQLQGGGKVQVK